MKRRLARALLFGNLLTYTVLGALLVYFNYYPAVVSADISSAQASSNANPFLSIALPTPTEFATVALNTSITPIPLDTPTAAASPTGPAAAGMTATPAPTLAPPPTSAPVQDHGLVPPSAINILLIGTDQRPGQSNWRTDVLILVSINQVDKTVGLLSIPRDLWVQIPGVGPQRINTADFYGYYYHLPGGGPESIKRTVEANLGIRVHYYVRVGFDAFRKAVDTLGGVDVDVNCPFQENNFIDDYGRVNLNFPAGVQHMDGVTALRYARSRYTTSDYDRSRRQRQVLLAMWDKALSLNLLPKWPDLYSQFQDSVQTDLGPTELMTLAWIGSQLHMDRIKSLAIDNRTTVSWLTPDGADVLLPQPEKIQSLLVQFFSPLSADTTTAEGEEARIEVVSGNTQAANLAAVELERDGLTIAGTQVTPTLAASSSLVVYNSKPATVQRLVSLLHIDPSNVRAVSDPAATVDLQVILGRDYNACQR